MMNPYRICFVLATRIGKGMRVQRCSYIKGTKVLSRYEVSNVRLRTEWSKDKYRNLSIQFFIEIYHILIADSYNILWKWTQAPKIFIGSSVIWCERAQNDHSNVMYMYTGCLNIDNRLFQI